MEKFPPNERARRADGLIEIADRLAGNEVTCEAVVVDDFADLCFLHAVDRLGVFVVIHQREADARRIDEVRLREHTDHFPTDMIDDREKVLIRRGEALAEARNRLGGAHGLKFFPHDMADGPRATNKGGSAGCVCMAA